MTSNSEPRTDRFPVSAVVLAGGRATRMGGADKGWVELAGRPLIDHVLDRLRPQVDEILINANRSQARYQALAPVIGDDSPDYLGPLAGMQAGLAAARHDWVLFVPCDGPALPRDLMSRFRAALTPQTELVVAHDGDWLQPVVALLHKSLLPSLSAALAEGERKIDIWFARHQMAVVSFADQPDAFINLNSPDELAAYEARLPDAATGQGATS
ncbi:molybdenum cofactor guanylyltransferase MobA [Aeromonas hydrophila]|uniref:Molybdenum cofactor guanylyltransferase n=1 Tax=Aeromonas hydrophila subsp. hydrophila (strain ATCC 7966 / DSM 30187 / BCRC 13018 / CCUG 14551 / JCM 1027 / KCTC 2358 / NCIMB 9240 / NCTC 8049) TaxID=380703 RepID=A0KMS8_AERHH|nr:molybdenum cofactor guanylyltransferase MobA [Aeromonas hydrophila]ABK38688.1 molybdopterin-guanine dinucleotide biosynthesis protein A [Aeromonas hydrophila subsp. hydrophila ATCC 7966]MBS4672001.1 molybdenum cofactor guanylyltransferase [Aeromonas hydrophila]OOD35686.1 molybdenum cofactor guanylyltransferase [Aeromonas hydrophila]SUU30824.1 molybdopterin-guanine dinucleotide biosynthesis protein A [Aeromonas hydrophila]